ncbi:MAG TPA: AzlD domain-containing protein [Anaerolineales bacterium]
MSILLIFVLGGLLTFGMRLSFIYLLGRVALPDSVRRMLRFVPAAVLSAIIAPELLLHTGSFDLSLGNTRLLAGLAAIAIAWWTKNTLITILAGMAFLLALQFLL